MNTATAVAPESAQSIPHTPPAATAAPDTVTATVTSDPWSEAALPAPTASVSEAPSPAADDPWSTSSASPADASSPWSTTPADTSASTDWAAGLSAASDAPSAPQGWMEQIQHWLRDGLPLQQGINDGLDWVVVHFRPFFQAVRTPIDATLSGVEEALLWLPWPALTALLALIAWQFAGRGLALGTALSLAMVALLGIWPDAMVTLSLVLTSLVFCVLIGLPLGIALAASDRMQRWMRPVLDAMQTTPAFVYLVPVVMLFGIGNVPGVIVTIIFALPPLVRLTNLGIRQVRPDLIEASRAYGASPAQLLWKVQLPLAMPSILAGINQALMLSLSMVVIASMIAVGGLGQMVLRGIGRLDMGLATVGGLGIVLLAIVLDRITQALGQQRQGVRWWQTGPVGAVLRLVRRPVQATPSAAAAPVPAAPRASVRTPTPSARTAGQQSAALHNS